MKQLQDFEINNAPKFLSIYEEELVDAKKSLRAYQKNKACNGITIYKDRIAGLKYKISELKECI